MTIKKIIYSIFLIINFKSFSGIAEDIIKKLSLEQKIAQLFIVGSANNFNQDLTKKLIVEYQVGGINFIGSGKILKVMKNIQELQSLSSLPLLISQDFEWGLNMRLTDAVKFPYNMTLGAIQDNNIIYKLGKEIARQCKLLGVHINFAPVADINSNPKNPVINYRSFGQDKYNVANKSISFAQGLQDGGIIACAKHFPGHGDTDTDSHLDLPIIKHSIKRIEDIELYPFKMLIKSGIKAIMSAHICVPKIDSRDNRSLTLSKNGITDLLQKKLNFSGLIITDALNMKAISKHFKPGQAELEAFIAGNDILLMSEDVPLAIATLKDAIIKGIIDEQELDRRVLKILKVKEELGLFSLKNCNQENSSNITCDSFNNSEALLLKQKLYESAITLVKNDKNLIPLNKNFAFKNSIAFVQISGKISKNKLDELEYFYIDKNAQLDQWQNLINNLKNYQIIILGLFDLNKSFDLNNGVTDLTLKFIDQIQQLNKNLILSIFGNPYCLRLFKKLPTIIMAYEPDGDAQLACAKIIFGQLSAIGILPIDL